MHKHNKIYELKCVCKAQAEAIKNYRIESRKLQSENMGWNDPRWTALWTKYPAPMRSSHQYRINHIAHCLLRGKTYEQIECKVLERNKLSGRDWEKIEEVRKQYEEIPQEVTI